MSSKKQEILFMTKLANKIISINNRRTSMRLCNKEWEAIDDICKRERINRNALIELIENAKNERLGLTYSTRLFLVLYYRSIAKPQRVNGVANKNHVFNIIKELA